ncbi:MAG: hypothetical protein RLZZ623_2116 [Actinomycetota bacterium]
MSTPLLSSAITLTPRGAPAKHRIGVVSTYPPKLCGLATFASALEHGLTRAGNRVDVVRIDGAADTVTTPRSVVAELVGGAASSVRRCAAALDQCDVAIIQHEYGIYGGPDGDEVLDLMRAVHVPIIVVLHTVPLVPTAHQRSVLESVAELADRVIVMTATAMSRLTSLYAITPTNVEIIPHGASVAALDVASPGMGIDSVPQLLTWGLIGPGKGIEHTISALALLGDLHPHPRYTVAGVTHPKVFANEGDRYRHSLIERSNALGVADDVEFDDTYRNVAQLTRFIASSTAVLLPYDSRDQVTSGVLVDAIAAGRPVIATAFPHAVELLSTGAGIVVPHADPESLAAAIRVVLTDGDAIDSMRAEARRLAPSFSWDAVSRLYADLTDELVQAAEPVAI